MSKPEKKPPLSDRVYADLSERIRTCEIKPGEMIFEPGLAAHYMVSKTPVREALARLIEEGVVTKYARAGYLVNEIGVKDVLDGYHVRAVLEGDAAALAAQYITSEEIEHMEAIPVHAFPLGEYNREFHMAMVRASRNSRLVRLVRITYDDTYRLMALDPSSPVPGETSLTTPGSWMR
jgi:DNA-binding GntR family transcriptional regulator